MIIDSHAHLNFREYENELEDVIKRSFASDTQIITIGSNYESSLKAVEIANKYKGIWSVIGCHPDDLSKENVDMDYYKELVKSSSQVVGIGEVGLDFYRLAKDIDVVKDLQIKAFKQFIELANELDLPLVLHCRGEEDEPSGAYDLMLDILKDENAQKGVIHCYGGNLEQAKKFIDLGFYIGFTGIVTFKNAKELQRIAREIPLEKILVETDAPFLAPEPHRGEKNESSYTKYIVQKIADLKELTFDEVADATYSNTKKLFKI
jgi:TatD DNase family protein